MWVVERADRMTVAQQPGDRQNFLRRRGREFSQVDLLSGPARPHRRQRLHDADIRIKPAQRIGVPARRAARMEQKIVEVPQDQVGVALGRPQPGVAGGVEREQDLAIHQQPQQLDPRKARLPAQPLDRLRRRQHRDDGREFRIADPEQRGGARRFQHHLEAAPPQIGEARQHERVEIAEPPHARPIVGDLRLDDDPVLGVGRAREAVLDEAVAGQSPHQRIDLLVGAPPGRERGEPQPRAQPLGARRRARTEHPQPDRIAVEAGGELSVRARVERDVTAEPGRYRRRRGGSPFLGCGSAQAGMSLSCGGGRD